MLGVPAGRTYDPEDSLADDQSYRLGTQAGLGMSRPTSQSGVGMSGPGTHVGLGMSGPGSHAGLGMSGIAREGANYPNIHEGMADR